MARNAALLNALIPGLGPWPDAYNDLDAVGPYIREHLALPRPPPGFRREFWEGGPSQYYFTSYSAVTLWPTGRCQYSVGGISYIPAAFLYVSHIAPVALLGFGPAVWRKRPGHKTTAWPMSWNPGAPMTMAAPVPEGWDQLVLHMGALLSAAGIALLGVEQANAEIPAGSAPFHYIDGLEQGDGSQFAPARLLNDVLFHQGKNLDFG